MFLSKHIAVFGEGKFTRASHTLDFTGPGGGFSVDQTVEAMHGVGGVSFHFKIFSQDGNGTLLINLMVSRKTKVTRRSDEAANEASGSDPCANL